MKKKTILPALLMIAAIMGVAYAAFSFTQRFPAIPATVPPDAVRSNCNPPGDLVTTTASVVAQSTEVGYILFSCPGGVAALTSGTAGGSATPTFILPDGYEGLGLIAHAAGVTTCTGASVGLSSDSAHTFFASENWDYCASHRMVPLAGLATFTITWSGT
jgi:hypothetical protein